MGRYKCEALDADETKAFIEENHSQGAINDAGRGLGLYLKEELVGVLHVGPPRTSTKAKLYSAEIYRLAFKRGIRAPGGASKLIKSYIAMYHPADFFTYQDTSGENTKVYEHSGMTLVTDGLKSRKQYLVAPGKTLATGSRKEVLGMPYATRYGPDRILGSKLGEIYREDGTRKSNKDIFLEDLGWHIEETTGDTVWEWVDPERTYYTYKITADDSDKYYYGVSHVKKANASLDDCLHDGYFGSGNSSGLGKFGRWKSKHKDSLVKEVLSLHQRKSQAYAAEQKLIGDLFAKDSLCLNSIAGGKVQPHAFRKYTNSHCRIHGETLHSNSNCLKCQAQKSYSFENCDVHGKTSFHGGKCQRCSALSLKLLKRCSIHGLTKHQGNSCYKCMANSTLNLCSIHGETKFYGGECMRCRNQKQVTLGLCTKHGSVKHIGDKCYLCVSGNAVQVKLCPIHGESKHRGDKCFKCRSGGPKVTEKECPIHGLAKHQGDTCAKCSRGKIEEKLCEIHGMTKHRGDACFKCAAAKRLDVNA